MSVSRRLMISCLMLVGFMMFGHHNPVSAVSPNAKRTITVEFDYVSVYKNRLVNAQAAVAQLQQFFDTVQWKAYQHYSFLRDVLHNDLKAENGYVDTPLGYGFGACGASSLLNKLVQTATFHNNKGQEEHLFQTVLVWTWRGDKTYGQYGATIYLDPTRQHSRDYIWQINPHYTGSAPKLSTHFDLNADTVDMTVEYSDTAQ